ncbi:MAG: flagellar hook-associated protein FlgL [Fimbriimonadaceae bacterium]|nr:flagellar hook-associated protein FlgL [Fimbriimonadaceae bacterium]
MRVTDGIKFRQSLSDLDTINAENAELLLQAGTGRRIHKPSDDPAGAVRQMRLKKDIRQQADQIDRITVAAEEVRRTELAMDDSIHIFERARELAVQGTSSARTDTDFGAIAEEADQLLHDLVAIGNRQVAGKFVFGGTQTTAQPFTMTGSPVSAVTYNGDGNSRTVSPSPGLSISVNLPGDEVFVNGTDTFQALIDLRDAARSQDVQQLGTLVSGGLDDGLDKFINQRTQVGAIYGSLDSAIDSLELQKVDQEALLADVEDVDLVDVLVRLKSTETQRTAALQAAARVVQASLLDFMA